MVIYLLSQLNIDKAHMQSVCLSTLAYMRYSKSSHLCGIFVEIKRQNT